MYSMCRHIPTDSEVPESELQVLTSLQTNWFGPACTACAGTFPPIRKSQSRNCKSSLACTSDELVLGKRRKQHGVTTFRRTLRLDNSFAVSISQERKEQSLEPVTRTMPPATPE